VEKQNIIASLNVEVDLYGPHLTSIVGSDRDAWRKRIAGMPVHELQTMLHTVKHMRSVANAAHVMKNLVYIGAGVVERGTKWAGMFTDGYASAIVAQGDELEMCIREYINTNGAMEAVARPELRAAFILSTTLLMVDQVGRERAKNAGGASQAVAAPPAAAAAATVPPAGATVPATSAAALPTSTAAPVAPSRPTAPPTVSQELLRRAMDL
jgi:hypothetical protein